MRNLKRALSLTLASVMLLGMMVVGAGAASYPDVDESNNIEAIEVLQAVKVMEGDSAGNFDPDRPVSRAEMAVIMALLLNLDYDYYRGTKTFNDVPNWCAPYVAACYANGIISGYNATTYGSADTVNAVQAASMMMRALGYFKFSSDYEGDFVLSTVKQASKIELFKGINANSMDPLTRNQVAQLALNTLESTMVDARKSSADIVVGSGDTAVTINGQVEYIVRTGATNSKMATAIKSGNVSQGSGTDGTVGETIELGEQLYSGDLVKRGDTDVFGAPSTRWVYKNSEIGVYADEADVEYTEEVKLKDIYKDLGLTGTVKKDDIDFWIDGVSDNDANKIYANDGTTDLNGVALVKSGEQGDLKLGGNGVLVKAYKGEDKNGDDTVTICAINTYVLQVDGEYDTRKEELRLKELDDVKELPSKTDTKLSSDDYDNLDRFNDEDYVLVTVADSEIQTIKAAETLSETVTAYVAKRGDGNSNSVTAGGVTYKYNKNYTAKTYEVKEQYVLVLDSYGYVIFTDGVDVDDQYLYVVSARPRGGVKADMEADAYFEDGTNQVIVVTGDSVSDLNWDADNGDDNIHAWFKYEKKSGDKYELTTLDSGEDLGGGKTKVANAEIADTNKAKVLYNKTDNKTLLANSDTVFIVLRDGAVSVYNGIREIPTITAKSTGAYVNAVMDGSYAKYVFIEAEEKGDLTISGGVDDHIYIYDEEPSVTTNDDGDKVYTYNVIKDGELTTIEMSSKTYESNKNWTLGLYGDLTTDGSKYIDSATAIVNSTDDENLKAYKVDGPKVEIKGDVLNVGGAALVLDRDYTIWVSDGDDTGKLTRNQFNRDYDEGFKGVLFVVLDDDKVVELYVEEDEDVFREAKESKITNVWQQPESEEEIADRLTSGLESGHIDADITGSEGLVSLGVTQTVTENESGVPVIQLRGTLDKDKVFTKGTTDDDGSIKKMLSIWYYGNNESGEPKDSFDSIEAALKAIYGDAGADYTIGAVVFSYSGYTQIQLLKKRDDGVATNGAGQTEIKKNFTSSVDCILDVSELKFPS